MTSQTRNGPPDSLEAPLSLDPADWSTTDIYHLQTALIVPRPIAWVSTQSLAGANNLAPHSYFNGVSDDPPMVMFCIQGKTDTYDNLQHVPEFVVSFVTSELAQAMEISAVHMPPDEDEFLWAGLASTHSECVAPLRVRDAYAALECKMESIAAVGNRNQMVIGRVVRYHVSDAIWRHGRVDPGLYRPIGRLAGQYCEQGGRFKLHRPDFDRLQEHGTDAAVDVAKRTPLRD